MNYHVPRFWTRRRTCVTTGRGGGTTGCRLCSSGAWALRRPAGGGRVALKQAVVAWVGAPEAEKAARFASAESIRWVEWGARSYQTFMLGLTLILLGLAVVFTANPPKALGYLMGLSGLAYLVQGWVVGVEGFPETNTFAILAGYVLILVWSIWLVAVTWLTTETPGVTAS